MKNLTHILTLTALLTQLALAKDFLVPLDDRPANRLFVEQIARIGHPQEPLQVVPRHLLGKLYTPGQSEAIAQWLNSRVQPGDTVFLCADMWLYGGLVASRTSAVSPEQVRQRLAVLERLSDKGVKLHVLATIPRLSLRTSDEQAPSERTLANWAAKGDLAPAALLLERLESGEEVGPEGVPAEHLREYLQVRLRNAATITRLIQMAADGKLESLVLGQDDSHKDGLHRFEQAAFLEQREQLGADNVKLLSGIDELTMTMVSGELATRDAASPTVRVIYSEPDAADKVPPLETLPLNTMVVQHLELAGATPLNDEGADVDLFVYVPSNKPWNVPGEERRPQAEEFVNRVRQAQQGGRRVAVADLSLVNRMDPFLAESTMERLDLYRLQGFASWNTPANTVGTVVSQLVCHRIAETSPEWSFNQRLESEKTHQAFLMARLIDDYLYQTVVRDKVKGQTSGLDSTADPLLNLFGPVGLEIRQELISWAQKIYDQHFYRNTFCLLPHQKEVRFEQAGLRVTLPWPRIFEVEARLDIRLGPTGESCPTER